MTRDPRADVDFISTEGSKLSKLVEAQHADRPVPIVSFVARQRDLRELVGDSQAGALQLQFADTFEPRPPLGGNMKAAVDGLLDRMLEHHYPAHPIFDEELRPAALRVACAGGGRSGTRERCAADRLGLRRVVRGSGAESLVAPGGRAPGTAGGRRAGRPARGKGHVGGGAARGQALDPVAARAAQSKAADLLAELRAANAAALSPALALGLEARMAEAASALAAVALSGDAKEIPRAWERVQYAVEHDRAAEHRERTERLLMAARLATWFMHARHDVKRGLWRFHHQPVDDRNPDRAEPLAVTKTKADIEGPLVDCGPERSQDDLRRIGYPVVARERSNACAVDRRHRRKNVQVYNARKVVGTRPGDCSCCLRRLASPIA